MTTTFAPDSDYERVRLECAEIRPTEDATALIVKLLLWSYDEAGKLHAYWIDKTLAGDALSDYLLSIIRIAGAADWEQVKGSYVLAVRAPNSRRILGLAPVAEYGVEPAPALAFDKSGEFSAVGIGTMVAGGMVEKAQKGPEEDQAPSYNEEVSAWLDDEYGITASADVADRLIDGEEFVVDYDGTQITISIIETTDGDLALVDENRAPLKAQP